MWLQSEAKSESGGCLGFLRGARDPERFQNHGETNATRHAPASQLLKFVDVGRVSAWRQGTGMRDPRQGVPQLGRRIPPRQLPPLNQDVSCGGGLLDERADDADRQVRTDLWVNAQEVDDVAGNQQRRQVGCQDRQLHVEGCAVQDTLMRATIFSLQLRSTTTVDLA